MNYSDPSLHKNHRDVVLPTGVVLSFSRPLVMAIINCTPDSFYAPSRNSCPQEAADQALAAEAQGADIVDFGGESTRPDAVLLDEQAEIHRLIPALRQFRRQSTLPVSVDTRKAAVARLALDEGADIINDVSALADPAMIPLCAQRKAAVVVMHSPQPKNAPTMGAGADFSLHNRLPCGPQEVRHFLAAAAQRAAAGGIDKKRIIVDPGFGFGKNAADNFLLLNRLATIAPADYPLLVGLSRKRFVGEAAGRDAQGRLAATITANAYAILAGADIIRVHDTAAAADMVKVLCAVQNSGAAG